MGLDRLGIIPAAGKASRFGGIMKELLPFCGETFLHNIVRTIPADNIVIVTSANKIAQHASAIGSRAMYMIQEGENDIFSAILTAIQIKAERYYFAMPDTYISRYAFAEMPLGDFELGVFRTDTPERYGVIDDNGVIHNKDKSQKKPAVAWGILSWTRAVRDYWLSMSGIQNYTEAFNLAMSHFGYDIWWLDYYYDMASQDDYVRLLKHYA